MARKVRRKAGDDLSVGFLKSDNRKNGVCHPMAQTGPSPPLCFEIR
jgi:hypothetical protein